MHSLSASFVLGYHGCSREVGEAVLRGENFLKASENAYDWLGSGVYFWEANPARGLEWARGAVKQGKFAEPFVIGAVIDLGFCLDLLSHSAVNALKAAYDHFLKSYAKSKKFHDDGFPINSGGKDLLRRNLDCAVINYFHELREQLNQRSFDTVRGVFVEGDPIYQTAGFHHKTHIQIAVRNLQQIKGVFRVPDDHLK